MIEPVNFPLYEFSGRSEGEDTPTNQQGDIFPYMDEIFKVWLKIIDDYVVPFLRTKKGMYIICAVILVVLIAI